MQGWDKDTLVGPCAPHLFPTPGLVSATHTEVRDLESWDGATRQRLRTIRLPKTQALQCSHRGAPSQAPHCLPNSAAISLDHVCSKFQREVTDVQKGRDTTLEALEPLPMGWVLSTGGFPESLSPCRAIPGVCIQAQALAVQRSQMSPERLMWSHVGV